MKRFSIALVTTLLAAVVAVPLPAQEYGNWDAGRPQMTRQELTDLLTRLEEMSNSSAVSGTIRSKAREEARMVQDRLTNGDIRVGDQIFLQVEGEDALTNTFTVRPGTILTLPGVGDVSLQGVLRSELESRMQTELAKYLRRPVVRAESLIRVTITGAVTRPGFYGVRPERLLSDAVMEAGGPVPGADLNSIYIERAGQRIWDGEYLQRAIADGRTLDQLSLQAGDQIYVPARRPAITSTLVSVGLGVLSATALVVTILTRM